MEFGTTKTTIILDDNGSTETIIENYHSSEIIKPVRKSYEIKLRVRNQEEEHRAYIDFSDELQRDKTMLDPCFKLEFTKLGRENGFYYVVKCFTQLQYL